MNRIIALFAPDRQADRVVTPSGFTAQLTLFTAGAMAFLAVFALALSLASGRLALGLRRLLALFGVTPSGGACLQFVGQRFAGGRHDRQCERQTGVDHGLPRGKQQVRLHGRGEQHRHGQPQQ